MSYFFELLSLEKNLSENKLIYMHRSKMRRKWSDYLDIIERNQGKDNREHLLGISVRNQANKVR